MASAAGTGGIAGSACLQTLATRASDYGLLQRSAGRRSSIARRYQINMERYTSPDAYGGDQEPPETHQPKVPERYGPGQRRTNVGFDGHTVCIQEERRHGCRGNRADRANVRLVGNG